MLEGKEMEFYATVVGDKKFIKTINLFEVGTKDPMFPHNSEFRYNISLDVKNCNTNNDKSKCKYDLMNIYIDGSNNSVVPIEQEQANSPDDGVVYYYPANSSEVILNIPHSYVDNFNKADIIVESVGSAENHSLYFVELDVYYPSGVRADITGLPSGMYRVRYRQTGTQSFLYMEDLYIIPESYAYYPLSATGQTLKSSYLSQMFGFNYSAANTHIGYIKSRMNEVCSKYINDGLIGANEFFDNDGTIEVFLVPPEADNQVFGGYPTYYRSYLESDAGASMIGYNNEDRTKFKFRANYQNFSLYNVYGNESNFIAYLAAHEVFHWITRSLVPLLRYSISINDVDFTWLDEGLSTMSQAYCYPNLELLQQNSSFTAKSNNFITNEKEKWEGIFSRNYLDVNHSPYYRGLFFYYLAEHEGLGIDFIKGILTNFQTMQDVSNSNYEDKIKELFESANNQISNPSFSSSDEILASFSSEFIKKQFLGNLLNYDNQDFYSMILGSGHEYLLFNYGGIATHKEVAPTDGQMHINLQIQDDNGQYGDFYCAVGVWDQNNNFVEGSFQEFYLNQELYEWYPVLDVNQGYKALAILLKLNEIEEQETVSYLLNMQFQEAGAPLTCDFCCNYEQINSQNENSVQIAPNNTVRYESICTGEGLSYHWNFEGGEPSVSNSANPQVYYSTPGEYNVSLQVINASNEECIDSREDYIMVWGYGFPVAAFGVNGSTIINPGDQVQFIDQSFNSAYVTWSFPNGEPNTSDEQNPVVTYYEPGIYNVSQQAHTPPESHGLTSWNYITVLNPNNLEINCIIEELVLPNEPVYSTAHLVAAPNNNTFYTYEFNFGDGFINEVTTNELWVSSDWHSYVQPGDYDFVLSVYNENNTMVSSCTKTIFVRDIFQPIDVNLVLEPANPALGEPFEITVESDAYGDAGYTWFSNGTQFNYHTDVFNHTISVAGSYTYRVQVSDNSGRPPGEDEITIYFEEPGECFVAQVDEETACFQYGEPMYVKSTSYCSNSDGCIAYNGNNNLNEITDVRWTLFRENSGLYFEGQQYCNIDETDCNVCHINFPSATNSYGEFTLVLEVWNRFDNSHNEILNYSEEPIDNIFWSNDHLQNPYYDKVWIRLEPSGGNNYTGTAYLCGWHWSNRTYTKKIIIAADHNGCTYTVNPDDNINFFAKEFITLRKGFSALSGSDFTAKLSCGHIIQTYTNSSPYGSLKSDLITGSIIIYPNPTNNFLNIDCSSVLNNCDSNEIEISVYDTNGKKILSNNYKNMMIIQLNLEEFAPAEYYIKIQTESEDYFEKVIVQR